MTRTFLRLVIAAALALAASAASAVFDPVNDDTDIFLANPSFNASRPNVLIFLDNTANWSSDTGSAVYAKKFDAVKAGLLAFINDGAVLTENYNVGFATFTETGQDTGAYVRYALRQMNATNRPALYTTVNNLARLTDNTNNGAFSMAMAEMYTYWAGVSTYTSGGRTANKRDYVGNASSPGGLLTSGHALGGSGATVYNSPISDGCQKNFIIFISNGPSTANADNTAAKDFLASVKGSTPVQISGLSPSGSEGDWADEWAQHMANADCNAALDGTQNVITYAIDILPSSQQQEEQHSALLASMAEKGKGKYYKVTDASTTNQFTGILAAIFKEVQAVNSVFASTTLPVSVNVRGTNLNQVYIGVFRPDADKKPRWLGNLKLYRLGVNPSTQNLFLADSTGAAAENASTGFVSGSARSFWTAASTYWGYRDASLNGTGGNSDSPDGDLVEKGGAAQQLRLAFAGEQATRRLYTCLNAGLTGLCSSGSLLSASPFDNTKVTAADLGAYTTYAVSSITSTGDTATLTLSAAPSPAWAIGNPIKVEGASPDNYNVSNCALTGVVSTLIYTYSLGACGKSQPSASTAQATGANHGLNTGDLVTVSATNATFNATDAPVTRVSSSVFQYPATGVAGSNGAVTVTGKKVVTSLTAPSGALQTATAVVAGHGYGTAPNTVTLTISGATPNEFNVTNATATIVDADRFTYTVSVSGSGTTGRATVASHGFTNGQTVYITGANEAGYNAAAGATITTIDTNTFTYSLGSGQSANATGTIFASVRIKYIVGAGNSDKATVTLYAAHQWANGTVIRISNSGGQAVAGYDFPNSSPATTAWTISNVNQSAGTFEITHTPNGNPNRLRNAPQCLKATGEANPTGVSSCTEMTNMLAGRAVTSIVPVVPATGAVYSAKSVNLTALSALTNASGSMSAGRPADGDNTLRDLVINWARGADNKENENPNTTPANGDIRPSVHGDVLHSRPAVVNYNRYADDNDIYAFYGSNDGIFHALKGGIAAHSSGADVGITPGTERWGFVPKEFFGKLRRLRDQSPTVSNVNQRDYFFDGGIGVYQKDADANGILRPADGDKVYLYVSTRRGGNFLYALDVTDPAAPRLLWRKGNGDTGWGEVGQTWSEPRITRINWDFDGSGNPERVVLIMGAGYDDTVEDINPCLLDQFNTTNVVQKAIGAGSVTYTAAGSCTISGATGGATTVTRTKGRGLLVIDAFTGNVLWQVGAAPSGASFNLTHPDMTCAISSDISVLDRNRDGIADRAYFGDTCGNVWRVEVGEADPRDWKVTRIASLSTGANTAITSKRKFLFPPDLVLAKDATGTYFSVLMGSGDREHPFDATVQNTFFMLKDRDLSSASQAGAENATTRSLNATATVTNAPIAYGDLFDATNTDGTNDFGWKINLLPGEKNVGTAVTIAGTTFFNTNQPSASAGGGSCGSNLGIAREYLVSFEDGSATVDLNTVGGITIADRSTIHAGGGYLPSPVPVVVEIDGKKYQAVISGTSVQTPPGLTLDARLRTYWYKEIDQ